MNETITRAAIVEHVAKNTGFSEKETNEMVSSVFHEINSALAQSKIVNITNFGKLEVVHKNKRRGRNPKNMKEYDILARNVLKFTPAKFFKKLVNNEEDDLL
jgi:nucleoid DNA-binding protein